MSQLPIILTAVLFTAALWRPVWALTALLVMFPLEMLLQGSGGAFSDRTWLFNAVTGVVVMVALIRRRLGGESLIRDLLTAGTVGCWGFYFWGYLSTVWTQTPGTFLAECFRTLPYSILIVGCAPMLISRVEEVRFMSTSVLLVGTGLAFLIITNPNFSIWAGRLRVDLGSDNMGNPLALGTLGGSLMVIAALSSFSNGFLALSLRATAFIAGAGLTLLSGSRGQMIAAVVAITIMLPIVYRFSSFRGVMATLAGAAVLVTGLLFAGSRFITADNDARWTAESLTTGGSGRFENAYDLLSTWIESPGYWIQGLGYRSFESIPNRSGAPYSHMLFADALGEAGLIGACLLGVAIVAAWRSGRRLSRLVADDASSRACGSIIIALVAYFLLIANKQGSMLGNPMLFAMIVILGRIAKERVIRSEAEEVEALEDWEQDEVSFAATEPERPLAPVESR